MSQSIARISTLAAARVIEAAEHLAIAGYGSRSVLARDKKAADAAGEAYCQYHGEAMQSVGFDPSDAHDVLQYMRVIPRCGCPDHTDSTPGMAMGFERDKHGRWPHYRDGIRVHCRFTQIGKRQSHQFSSPVDAIVRDALHEWEKISGLRFIMVDSPDKANITMIDGQIDGPQGTLAWSMLPWKGIGANDRLTNNQTGSSQLYDGFESWNDIVGQGVTLKWVIFHEIGHALGWGHSDDRRDAMFAAYIPGRSASLPGPLERQVASEDYPGPVWTPDVPKPPEEPPAGPKGRNVRVRGVFYGDAKPVLTGTLTILNVEGVVIGEHEPLPMNETPLPKWPNK